METTLELQTPDLEHFGRVAKMWAKKMGQGFSAEDATKEIASEITLFFYERLEANKNLDIFEKGHEGALYKLLFWQIRGRNLPSVGGTCAKSNEESDLHFHDDLATDDDLEEDERIKQLEFRVKFENKFSGPLAKLDKINEKESADFAIACNFSGANARRILAEQREAVIKPIALKMGLTLEAFKQLKTEISETAAKRVIAKAQSAARFVQEQAQQKMAMA